jgi:hypothetical protein
MFDPTSGPDLDRLRARLRAMDDRTLKEPCDLSLANLWALAVA